MHVEFKHKRKIKFSDVCPGELFALNSNPLVYYMRLAKDFKISSFCNTVDCVNVVNIHDGDLGYLSDNAECLSFSNVKVIVEG